MKPPATAGAMGEALAATGQSMPAMAMTNLAPEDVDNPFSEETLHRDISLSCYSTPVKCLERRTRPHTTPEQLLKRVPGFRVRAPPAGEEGEAAAPVGEPVREPVLPELADIQEKMTKDATEQYRQEQLNEVYSIKERLAREGQPSNLKVITKAILMPEEMQINPTQFKYPDISELLMKDPSPRAKKGKKKGKKKK